MADDPLRAHLDALLSLRDEFRARSLDPRPGDLTSDPALIAAIEKVDADLHFMDAALGGEMPSMAADGTALGIPSRYESPRFHDRGGMGLVYRAFDAELGREVAYKVIRPHLVSDRRAVAKFLGEAKVTARPQHPGVVPVYGMSADGDGRPAYAMRFVEGVSLLAAAQAFHEIPRVGPIARGDWLTPLTHFLRVCRTIHHAHCLGVLHRDLSPRNILLLADDETFVIDWGLASDVSPDDATVRFAPTRAGTAPYTAPEVFEPGEPSPFSPQSDVYSLGALLHLILTGRPPYTGDSSPEVIAEIRRGPPPVAESDLPGVPRPLSRICARALGRLPADRYPTADAMARDVEAWIARDRVSADREPWNERAGRWAARHRTGVISALIVLAGIAAVVLVSTARVRSARREKDAEAHRLFLKRQDALTSLHRAEGFHEEFKDPGLQESLATVRALLEPGGIPDLDPKRLSGRAQAMLKDLVEREASRSKAARDFARESVDEIRKALNLLESVAQERPAWDGHSGDIGATYLLLASLEFEIARPRSAILISLVSLALGGAQPSQPRMEAILVLIDRAISGMSLQSEALRRQLGDAWLLRTEVLAHLGRPTQTLMAMDRATTLVDGPRGRVIQLSSPVFIRLAEVEQKKAPWSRGPEADHAEAVAMADYLADHQGASLAGVYNAACANSLASSDPSATSPDRDRRAARAVALLDRIASAKYFDGPKQRRELINDPDLDPLRSRPDFRRILARLGIEPTEARR